MSYNLSRYNGSFLDPFLNLLIDDSFESSNYGTLAMKTDIRDEGKNYVLDIELPGFDKKDVSVSLKEGYLIVTASRLTDKKEKDEKTRFVARERFSGKATRSYYVGEVTEEEIAASFNNGILSIALPKEEERKAKETHSIQIN